MKISINNPGAMLVGVISLAVFLGFITALFPIIVADLIGLNSLGNFSFQSLFAVGGVFVLALSGIIVFAIMGFIGLKAMGGKR